jgi:hypothetical protein
VKNEPNRFRGLHGAARAAELARDTTRAKRYYRQLLDVCAKADQPPRPALAHAQQAS